MALAFGFEGRYRVIDERQGAARQRARSAWRRCCAAAAGRRRARRSRRAGKACRPQVARLRDGAAAVGRRRRSPVWCCSALYLGLALVARQRAPTPSSRPLQGLDAKPSSGHAPPPPPPPPARRAAARGLPEAARSSRAWSQVQRPRRPLDRHHQGRRLLRAGQRGDRRPRRCRCWRASPQALNATPGTVLITGHTDNQPIRTLRFRPTGTCRRTAPTRSRRCSASRASSRSACAPKAGPTPSRSTDNARPPAAPATAASRSRCSFRSSAA